jgi:hypothetical protein
MNVLSLASLGLAASLALAGCQSTSGSAPLSTRTPPAFTGPGWTSSSDSALRFACLAPPCAQKILAVAEVRPEPAPAQIPGHSLMATTAEFERLAAEDRSPATFIGIAQAYLGVRWTPNARPAVATISSGLAFPRRLEGASTLAGQPAWIIATEERVGGQRLKLAVGAPDRAAAQSAHAALRSAISR